MDEVVVEMGKRIAHIRKERNLTQDQLAELVGLTTQTVSSAERGTKALRPENIVKLCQALRVTPNDLLLGTSREALEGASSSGLSKLSPQKRRRLDELVRLLIEALLLDD